MQVVTHSRCLMLKIISLSIFFFICFPGTAQEIEYQAVLLPSELTENANAIIRKENIKIELKSVDEMTITTERVVTVLNEYGNGISRTYDFYDEETKIKKQEAIFYDKMGNQLKRVKQKDFLDNSLPGANLITDTRVSYYDFTPREYPYTVVYTSETTTGSTIFVRPWVPVPGYYVSVQNATYRLINTATIPLRFEENNLDSLEVTKVNSQQELNYSLTNLPSYKKEILSPEFDNFAPEVKVALDEFSLVGVKGTASDWSGFGKWQYENLLAGKAQLPEETVEKMKQLTSNVSTDLEKAELIYKYVQENTRYISVQLGIGGWEPMSAMEVDKLGYGDCKALTNYTRALLASQDITSHYAVVYGNEDKTDLDADFVSMQGNHVILNIPSADGDVWLECTSQTVPFNYLGDFTDDRNVLLVKPKGGEIVKTRVYKAAENLQETKSTVHLDADGNFSAEIIRKSFGVPYGNRYGLMRQTEKDQHLYYKNNWGHLRNLEIQELSFTNKRQEPEFLEELKVTGQRYAARAGERILLPLHFLEPASYDLSNNPDRKLPIEIQRGLTYNDIFEFVLPKGFAVESLPESLSIENEYGIFHTTVQKTENNGEITIIMKRHYLLREGTWPSESYAAYRDFMNQVKSTAKQKAVIIKTI